MLGLEREEGEGGANILLSTGFGVSDLASVRSYRFFIHI